MPTKQKPAEGITVSVEDKLSLKSTLKNDLLGADDWKRSKIGYLTGFSSFVRMGRSVTDNFSTSINRTRVLWNILFGKRDDIPSLPEAAIILTPHQKFAMAQKLHKRTETELKFMLNNTCRLTIFYSAFAFFGLSYSILSIYLWPLAGISDILFRFCIPLALSAFTVRAAYTNYMVRNRALYSLRQFITSREWLPHKDFNKK